ncbi:pirin family protein [Paenibacillus sp. MSJ-34]|uniref:pirin family protein n=1 Tax=Paenibacillus sp. MSJ-34 TaxID=2841529 RepID=UPI001C11F2BB|nr:pirin family protein [Paenibacillus sp. MSJ-34]MBU5440663.1 pirin family protein [Paenibacillus sp. MSJ-34]
MQFRLYPPALQGKGEFDGGAIVEQKPIGFPREGSAVKRIGPLFYWAWAHAPREGFIDSHPHQAFEIVTYVIQGEAHHGDSLGTQSVVGPGGAQVIQAGSGVYHNERLVGPDAEIFQIWFEPSIRDALRRDPTYRQYEDARFTRTEREGAVCKKVIGEGSPIALVADANMWDVRIESGAQYVHEFQAGRSLALLAVRGEGSIASLPEGSGDDSEQHAARTDFKHRDFVVADAESGRSLIIRSGGGEALRAILIEVPARVDYPLYPKRN